MTTPTPRPLAMTAHPEWPSGGSVQGWEAAFWVERALYAAAMSRLREAVQYIREMADSDSPENHATECECWSCEARALLARIGPLPEDET